MPSLLIVDDLLSIHEMLDAVIQPIGYATAFATDGEKGLAKYKQEKFDLVLADVDMKPMDGLTLLKQLKQYDPQAVVIIMTAYSSTESAIQALKYGAFDYLQKPFRVDELIATLKRGLDFRQFHARQAVAAAAPAAQAGGTGAPGGVDRLAGTSAAHKRVLQQISKLAGVRTPVLLQGESGIGKTTVAEILHGMSAPAGSPLVTVDCALSTEADFRAGLIGQTGEGGRWVKEAAGGTLLLQNISRLSEPMQSELVSVIRTNIQNLRLVCTSTEDLEQLTDEGRFNDELFYRVASLPVVLPPLRERTEDIPVLVSYFASKASNPSIEVNRIEFAPDALAVLKTYRWPGNVSELAQTVTAVVSGTGSRVIAADQLPLRIKSPEAWPTLAGHLAALEKQYVDQVLRACGGDKARAAQILGVEASRLG